MKYPSSFNDVKGYHGQCEWGETLCFQGDGCYDDACSWASELGYGSTIYGFYGTIVVVTALRTAFNSISAPERRDDAASEQYGGSILLKNVMMISSFVAVYFAV